LYATKFYIYRKMRQQSTFEMYNVTGNDKKLCDNVVNMFSSLE